MVLWGCFDYLPATQVPQVKSLTTMRSKVLTRFCYKVLLIQMIFEVTAQVYNEKQILAKNRQHNDFNPVTPLSVIGLRFIPAEPVLIIWFVDQPVPSV